MKIVVLKLFLAYLITALLWGWAYIATRLYYHETMLYSVLFPFIGVVASELFFTPGERRKLGIGLIFVVAPVSYLILMGILYVVSPIEKYVSRLWLMAIISVLVPVIVFPVYGKLWKIFYKKEESS